MSVTGWIITVVVIWAVCGVLAYGLCIGDFFEQFKSALDTRKFRRRLRWFALGEGLAGPFGLIVELQQGSRRFRYLFPPRDQRGVIQRHFRDFATGEKTLDVFREFIRTGQETR